MRVAFAQIDPIVGAFEANVRKILEAYQRACDEQARFLLTPEMSVCGYPPHDLVERPEMFDRNESALEELQKATIGKKCALLVGHCARNPGESGRAAQNVVTVLENGKRVFRQAKTLLPTYDVFDESRYFEPAIETGVWTVDGVRVGLAICEDLWASDPAFERRLYRRDPVEAYKTCGVDLLLSCSASPYIWGKRERREQIHATIAKTLKAPLLYVNQVGATDEVLFDGGSFAVDAAGKLVGRLPLFETAFGVLEVDTGKTTWASKEASTDAPAEIDVLARGLVSGVREYFFRSGFKKAVLGLSGGIDSAVCAVIAAKALGPENVLGIAMPSQFSSSHSLADAEALARNLKIRFEVRPIKFSYSTLSRELKEGRGELAPIALENLQARLRGVTLMTLSNHDGSLVITTGNKSEMAVGYCTMYGDMCGAIAPLGDLLKTRVYELARHMNQIWGAPIPESSLTKEPSAELKPGQKDQDSLPPYSELDPVLEAYLEKQAPLAQIMAQTKAKWVPEILRRVEINEYKRRQAAPVLKVSPKAFGIGRRIPISKHWDTHA